MQRLFFLRNLKGFSLAFLSLQKSYYVTRNINVTHIKKKKKKWKVPLILSASVSLRLNKEETKTIYLVYLCMVRSSFHQFLLKGVELLHEMKVGRYITLP